MIGIAENEHFKIFEGINGENKMWAVHLKGAKASFHLGSVAKVLFCKALHKLLQDPGTVERGYSWVGLGNGTFYIQVFIPDIKFLLKYLPLSEAEQKLAVEEGTEPPQRAGTMH